MLEYLKVFGGFAELEIVDALRPWWQYEVPIISYVLTLLNLNCNSLRERDNWTTVTIEKAVKTS